MSYQSSFEHFLKENLMFGHSCDSTFYSFNCMMEPSNAQNSKKRKLERIERQLQSNLSEKMIKLDTGIRKSRTKRMYDFVHRREKYQYSNSITSLSNDEENGNQDCNYFEGKYNALFVPFESMQLRKFSMNES